MIAAAHNFNTEKVEQFLSAVKNSIPIWVMGTEELSHQNGLINVFQHLSSGKPMFEEVSAGLSLLAWQQNPFDRSAAVRCMGLNDTSCPASQLGMLQN